MNKNKYSFLCLWVFFAICINFLCVSCEKAKTSQKKTKEWMQSSPSLRVLTTTAHVAALVREVGGSECRVLELIQGESDPHSYQLVKGDDEKFRSADIVFYSGLGLEHGPSLVSQLQMVNAISIGDKIAELDTSYPIYLNGTPDPHMWMDVSLWAKGAFIVRDALSKIRPQSSEIFHKNAEALFQKLMKLDEKGAQLFSNIPQDKRHLVTTHDAFNYFTRRYLSEPNEKDTTVWQLRCKAPEGLAPDSQISTQDILQIADYIIQHKVLYMFAEVGINQGSLQKLQEVLQEKKYSITIVDKELYSDSMGEEGTQAGLYEGMIWHNMQTIEEYLRR